MEINFKNNLDKLAKDLDKINKNLLPRAAQQAINKAAQGVKVDAVKAISKESAIQQKVIRGHLKVEKSKRQSLRATVDAIEGRGKNLINSVDAAQKNHKFFRAKKSNGKFKFKGVKAKAWGKTKSYRGTFIGTGKNNNVLVFARTKGVTSSGKGKLKSITGPSPRHIFMTARQKLKNSRSASKRFNVELDRAIKFQLSKLNNAN